MNSTDYIAIGGLITIIGTVVVNIIVALRTKSSVAEVKASVAEVKTQADVITGHVNSAASASVTKIDGLQIQVTELKTMLAAKDQTAAVLAATTAIKDNQ